MSDEQQPNEKNPSEGEPAGGSGTFNQEIRHSQVSARVPEGIGRGVFSTGAVVVQGPQEFVIDFLLRMTQPHMVAARVILPPAVVPRFVAALRENLNNYQKKFGPPPALPAPPPGAKPPSIEEIYDQLKLPDETLSGVYANAVMIGHTPSEFCLDFITNFFPRSAVSCRVYLSAPQVPRFLDTITRSFEQYQQKLASAQQQQAQFPPSPQPDQPPPPDSSPDPPSPEQEPPAPA